MPTGKNIRSLADLQKAIKKADAVKAHAKEQGELGEQRRKEGETRKKQMTREERRAYRQSKRLTVELQHSESRVKVLFIFIIFFFLFLDVKHYSKCIWN